MGCWGDSGFDDLHRPTSDPIEQGAHRSFPFRPGPPATPALDGLHPFHSVVFFGFGDWSGITAMLLRIVLIIRMERLAQHVSNCRLERTVVVFNLSAMRWLQLSILPLVWGWLELIGRWSMPCWAQV